MAIKVAGAKKKKKKRKGLLGKVRSAGKKLFKRARGKRGKASKGKASKSSD